MVNLVYQYLKEKGSITNLEAVTELYCYRLSEYIHQLRRVHRIDDEWIKTTNYYGKPTKYKKYYLVEENE